MSALLIKKKKKKKRKDVSPIIVTYRVYHCCNIHFYLPFFPLGGFEDPDIIHVDDSVDPVRDLETISEELRLKVCINFFLIFLY